MPSVVAHAWNHSTKEAKVRRLLWVQDQTGLKKGYLKIGVIIIIIIIVTNTWYVPIIV